MAAERRIADIHMHLIPGVDDGSESIKMSLEMVRTAMDQGVRTIICTPHDIGYRGRAEKVRHQFEELQRTSAEIYPEVNLYMGCELYCDLYKMEKNFEYLASGMYSTMNGTDYVLTEFPISGLRFPSIRQMCGELIEHGYKPILAHTERFYEVIEELDHVQELKDMGCLVQVNAYSIAEEKHFEVHDWANQLLERRMIDFIGSDAHRTYHRPPKYTKGVNRIYEICSEDYADAICFGNAERLLIGGAK